jgi:hypothetical protein
MVFLEAQFRAFWELDVSEKALQKFLLSLCNFWLMRHERHCSFLIHYIENLLSDPIWS